MTRYKKLFNKTTYPEFRLGHFLPKGAQIETNSFKFDKKEEKLIVTLHSVTPQHRLEQNVVTRVVFEFDVL